MSLSLPDPPKTKSLVAVSGGRDSVVLLDLLHRAGARKLVVVHLNHRLRGRASAADARFVETLAAGYGFVAHVGREDVSALAARESLSLETAGRRARHAFFAEVARAERTNRVYLAHHAADQAETILQNLFRGTGPAGLCGMAPETPLRVGRRTLSLLRPLLFAHPEAIRAHAETHGLKHREDASNTDRSFARNRIRHDLLGAAAAASGRDPTAAILRAFAHLREDALFLDSLAGEAAAAVRLPDKKLSAPDLKALPPALGRRVVLGWLRALGIPEITGRHVAGVLALADPGSGSASFNLPGGHRARRRARAIWTDRQ